jgi:hypothetical protein
VRIEFQTFSERTQRQVATSTPQLHHAQIEEHIGLGWAPPSGRTAQIECPGGVTPDHGNTEPVERKDGHPLEVGLGICQRVLFLLEDLDRAWIVRPAGSEDRFLEAIRNVIDDVHLRSI